MYGFYLLPSGSSIPKMHTKVRPARKGRGVRRVGKGIKKRRLVMKKHYKNGKEKDNKLMKKFDKVQETKTVQDTKIKVDPTQLIILDMVSC